MRESTDADCDEMPSTPDGPARGGAALEFAVVLPLLMTLMLGCVDFGAFACTYIAVTNAARAGAGFGSVHVYTKATSCVWKVQLWQAVQDEMQGVPGFNAGNLFVHSHVDVEVGGTWRTEGVVRYPFQTLISWPGLPADMTLSQMVVMRGTRY